MNAIIETTTEQSISELTAADRCDACGAQAYVRATLAAGDLFFCAHHAAEVRAKLEPVALEWHDETARLIEDAKVTA